MAAGRGKREGRVTIPCFMFQSEAETEIGWGLARPNLIRFQLLFLGGEELALIRGRRLLPTHCMTVRPPNH